MFERYNEGARRALFFARYEVAQMGGLTIAPEHLVMGVLRDAPQSVLRFAAGGQTVESLKASLEAASIRGDKVSTAVEIPFSRESKEALQRAAAEADDLKNQTIRPEHLLLGVLVKTSGEASRVLQAAGVAIASIREFLKAAPDGPGDATLHAHAPRARGVARLWTGVVARGREDEYITYLREQTIPALRRLRGFLTASILSREVEDGTEFQVATVWDSREAIQAFAGDDIDVAVVPPAAQALLVRYDVRAVHYDIVQ